MKNMDEHVSTAEKYDKVWRGGIYGGFSKNTGGERKTPLLADLIRRLSKKTGDKKVLEIGAGSGVHSLQLLNAKDVFVSAVEHSSIAVQQMKRLFQGRKNIKVIKADMFNFLMKSPAGHYDAVYANAVAHFLSMSDRKRLFGLVKKRWPRTVFFR